MPASWKRLITSCARNPSTGACRKRNTVCRQRGGRHWSAISTIWKHLFGRRGRGERENFLYWHFVLQTSLQVAFCGGKGKSDEGNNCSRTKCCAADSRPGSTAPCGHHFRWQWPVGDRAGFAALGRPPRGSGNGASHH